MTLATIGALVANGGVNIAAIYFLGQRPAQATSIIGSIATVGAVTSILAAAAAMLVGLFLGPKFLGDASAGVLVATAALAAGILAFELAGGILLGTHRRTTYIVVQVVEAIGSLVMTLVILLLVASTPAGFLAAAAAGYWLALGLAGAVIYRRDRRIRFGLSASFLREALAIGLRGQAGNLLQFLNLRLDLLLVPALLNLASAGVYVVAVRMSEVVTQVASSASTFLFPVVASQSGTATSATERTARFTLLSVAATGLPLAIATEPILTVFFGPDFAAGALAVRITLVAMIPLSLVRLLAGDLKGRGRPGLVSVAALVALVVTIVADLSLIPPFGIAGAALASLMSYSVSALLLLAMYQRVTGASVLDLLPRQADAALLAAGVRDRLQVRSQSR